MKRLALLLVSFGGLLHAQGCNFISPSSTPNIGLLLPSTNNSCNWGVYTNQSMGLIDLFLSGHSGLPAVNFLPQALFGNPVSGLTLYVNPGDSLFHVRNSAGVDAVLSGGAGATWGLITGTLSAQTDLQAALSAKQNLLTLPLSVANGGTGTNTPALIQGTNVTITGTWPNQTINATASGSGTVSYCGTPTSGQLPLWVDATHIQGVATIPDANMPAKGSAGSCGDSTHSCQVTFDTAGRETARANVAIAGGGGAATSISAGLLASRPVTCAAGDVYFATDQPAGEQLYQCSATNTWTETFLHDTTLTNTAGQFGVNLSQFCRLTNSCTISALWGFAIGQDWTKQASGSTPSAGLIHPYANNDNTPHYVTSDGVDHTFGGSGTFNAVKAQQSVGQAIPGSFTGATLLFDTNVSITTGTMHSTSSNTGNFVVPSTGWWGGTCNVFTDSAGVGNIAISILVNGASPPIASNQRVTAVANGYAESVPYNGLFTAGDIVTCFVEGDVGFTTSSANGLGKTNMSLYQIH